MKATGLVLDAERSVDVEPDEFSDRSRFGNDGVFINNPTWVRLPSGLWVLELVSASAQYINIPAADSLQVGPNGEITIMLWINGNTFPAANTGIIGFNPVSEWHLLHFGVIIYFRYNDVLGALQVLNLGGNLATGRWYHIGVTYTDSTMVATIMVNGNALAPATGTQPMRNTAWANLWISRYITAYFNGYMWGWKIYNYALTPGQILKHYEAERRFFGV